MLLSLLLILTNVFVLSIFLFANPIVDASSSVVVAMVSIALGGANVWQDGGDGRALCRDLVRSYTLFLACAYGLSGVAKAGESWVTPTVDDSAILRILDHPFVGAAPLGSPRLERSPATLQTLADMTTTLPFTEAVLIPVGFATLPHETALALAAVHLASTLVLRLGPLPWLFALAQAPVLLTGSGGETIAAAHRQGQSEVSPLVEAHVLIATIGLPLLPVLFPLNMFSPNPPPPVPVLLGFDACGRCPNPGRSYLQYKSIERHLAPLSPTQREALGQLAAKTCGTTEPEGAAWMFINASIDIRLCGFREEGTASE